MEALITLTAISAVVSAYYCWNHAVAQHQLKAKDQLIAAQRTYIRAVHDAIRAGHPPSTEDMDSLEADIDEIWR